MRTIWSSRVIYPQLRVRFQGGNHRGNCHEKHRCFTQGIKSTVINNHAADYINRPGIGNPLLHVALRDFVKHRIVGIAKRGHLGNGKAEEKANQANQQSAVEALQEREDELTARLDLVSVRVEGAMELSTDMSQQLNRLDEDLVSLSQQLDQEAEARSTLSASVSQLRSRINMLEDGGGSEEFQDLVSRVDAIDIARTDTIQRLSNIQAQISELRDQVQALQGQ